MTKHLDNIKKAFEDAEDVKYYDICLPNASVTLVYIDGLTDILEIGELIVEPLKQLDVFRHAKPREIIELIASGQLYAPSVRLLDTTEDIVAGVLNGDVAIVGEHKQAVAVAMKKYNQRGIAEPTEENTLKGSKDCFVECLRTNTATLRSKIRSSSLKFERYTIGERSNTAVNIVYYEGIANPDMVQTLRDRLSQIKCDHVLTTSMIEEFIVHKRTMFPSIVYSERPDKFAADITEGCVCLLVDGLPLGLIMPATIVKCLQAPEDYSKTPLFASILRILRFTMLLITLFLPGFYIAITTFHQEMIPSQLVVSIEAAKQGVPFPTFLEVVLMLIAFEVLVEAGLRLPKNFGQLVSIVGAVVIGQATVTAKILSPAVVVVIAITAMAGYTIPDQDFSDALRVWRFILVVCSSLLGLTGLVLGGIVLASIWCDMETLGVPFMSPFATSHAPTFGDTILRAPMPKHTRRPFALRPLDEVRR